MREQRVLNHDLRHRVRRVRELERRADVARRIDARVAGPQVGVDLYAGSVVRNPCLFQPESFHVRGPADTDEDLVHGRLAGLAGGGVADPFPAPVRVVPGDGLHAVDRGVEGEAHPVALHPRLHHRRGVRIFSGQDMRGQLEHRHFTAEAGEGLGELATDGAGADDGKAPRQRRQREDGLVGQETRFREAGNRQGGGARPGADGGPREAQCGFAHAHGVASREAPLADEDVDTEPPETARPNPRG